MSARSNKNGLNLGMAAALALFFCLLPGTILASAVLYSSVYAQTPTKVRSIPCDFVPENGCPIAPTSIRCELDVDPFDAPMDARVYVDYRNNSDRPVSAVKFRLRFVDGQNRDRGTFHAIDQFPVSPRGCHGLKAKRDFTLHPAVVAIKARVLQVKYGDGSDWISTKMQELAQPGGGGGGGAAPAPAEDANVSLPPVPPANINPRVYENPHQPSGPAASAASSSQVLENPAASLGDTFASGTAASGQSQTFAAQSQSSSNASASAAASSSNPGIPQANQPAGAVSNPNSPPTRQGITAAAASSSVSPANAAAANPNPVSRYKGVQPLNVPYSPENDKIGQ